MDIDTIKRVHCIGIGGIGVSALARFFSSRGVLVTGSEWHEFDETDALTKEGFNISIGYSKKNIPDNVQLVIYTSALESDNEELLEAQSRNIETLSYTQALGRVMQTYVSIAVSGTNGKTTTTSILGTLLKAAGLDPTVVVGGRVTGWHRNLLLGHSDIFIAEACEYRRNMLNLEPHVIVLTNIEEDHLDYYQDLEDIIDAFSEYVRKLSDDDLLVYNNDDKNVREVAENTTARLITFGLGEDANIRAHSIINVSGKQQFQVSAFDNDIGVFVSSMPGIHNIYNILATLAVCFDLGVSSEDMRQGIQDFVGTWRRFELVGQIENKPVISDYAHHPTAIKRTLRAAKEMYGENTKILAVFQPHQKDRTVKLFNDFVESFSDADTAILSEIYEAVGREDHNQKISSKDLVRQIQERGGVDNVVYASGTKEAETAIRKVLEEHDIVVIMGAGSIDEVARALVV